MDYTKYFKTLAKYADKCHANVIKSQFASHGPATFSILMEGEYQDEEELCDYLSEQASGLSSYLYKCSFIGIDSMRLSLCAESVNWEEDLEYAVESFTYWCKLRGFGYSTRQEKKNKVIIDIIW